MKLYFFSFVVFSSLLMVSCKKGDTGPAGAAGQNGQTVLTKTTPETAGTNCPTGGTKIETGLDTNRSGSLDASEVTQTTYVCNGTNGSQGPAGTANVIYSDWIAVTAQTMTIAVPSLTQEIVDKGTVLVYLKNGTGYVFALPITIGTNYIRHGYKVGELYIEGNSNLFVGNPIRYIIIPGGVRANRLASKTSLPLSYGQVVQEYQLPTKGTNIE